MFGVFTPSQAKLATESRTDADANRARTLAKLTDELIAAKNQAEKDFEAALKRQQDTAEREFAAHTEKVKTLRREVDDLEQRRKEALSPPLIREEDISSVEEALAARELVLRHKEHEQDDQARALMRRLDELSSKEQACTEREGRLQRQAQGIEFQRTQVATDARNIAKQMEDFERMRSEKEVEFAYRDSELDARQNLFDQKDKLLLEREAELAAGKRLLADQRILLEKGFEELRRLQMKHGEQLPRR